MTQHDPTAAALIEAGIASLIDNPRGILERGLRSDDVINLAESSPATFFRKFSTKSDYLDAVVSTLSASMPRNADGGHEAVRVLMRVHGRSLRSTVTALVAQTYRRIVDDTATTTLLLTHVFGGSTSRALTEDYRYRDQLVLDGYGALFEPDGGALRRPFTARTFAMTLNALVDGFRLRSRVDPAAVTADLISDALLAFLGAVVDTSEHHQHLDDMVGTIARSDEQRPLPRDPRAAIIAVARDEFGKRGYFMTRTDDIADIAAVPRAACKKLFPTKPSIIVGALQNRVDQLRESVADDLLLGLDEVTVIENHLLRCAQLVSDELAFMDALLVAVAHDTYGEPEGLVSIKEKLNLPAIIAPVITQGQQKGTLRDFATAFDLAAGLTNTLLMRCFTRRQNSAADNATFVAQLLLRGVDAR